MKKILYGITAFIVLLVLLVISYDKYCYPEITELVPEKVYFDDVTVMIQLSSLTSEGNYFYGTGSGYIIDKEKNIIKTAYHVIESVIDSQKVELNIIHNNISHRAKILTIDPDNDLATLLLVSPNIKNMFKEEANCKNRDEWFKDRGEVVYIKGFIDKKLFVFPGIIFTENQVRSVMHVKTILRPFRKIIHKK